MDQITTPRIGSLPSGWTWKTMADISDIVGGGTPKTNDPSNYEGGRIPWITPADLSGYSSKYISHGARSITEKGLKDSSARMMPTGTILFSSRAPVGYVAIASNPVCTNQGFKSFVLKDHDVLPDYVYWWLKGNKELAESMASGTTFLELSGAKAKNIPIPIAPLDQQKLIVAEIEKQFSRLDEAVAGLKRVKTNLKRYKAAVLKAAVEGKLTKEWRKAYPDVEPASELLKRILVERRNKWEEAELSKVKAKGNKPKHDLWKKKYEEPASPEVINIDLPLTWTLATIEQLSDSVQYGSSAKTNESPNGIPVLRMGNIVDGELVLDDLKYLPKNHDEFPTLLLRKDDLLFNRTNSPELVGKTAVYEGMPKPCSFASYLIRIQFNKSISPKFINYFINSAYGRQWVKSVVTQQVGQANVNGTKLQALTVPLPPYSEQLSIVANIEERFSAVSETEREVGTNLIRAERLWQSTLKKAFSGNLPL